MATSCSLTAKFMNMRIINLAAALDPRRGTSSSSFSEAFLASLCVSDFAEKSKSKHEEHFLILLSFFSTSVNNKVANVPSVH